LLQAHFWEVMEAAFPCGQQGYLRCIQE